MRKLATVQRIKCISDIPGKDKIGLATFHGVGYQAIVNKQELKQDDLVVYFEIDSILPVEPMFEFLRQRCWCEPFNGFRIKAMKMGGLFSEGLALPIKELNLKNVSEGMDLTSKLKVRKYDPELLEEMKLNSKTHNRNQIVRFLLKFAIIRFILSFVKNLFNKQIDKSWPNFLSKTDETRIQNLNIFEEAQGSEVYVSEKMDGQSATYCIYKKEFIVCSRNLRLQKDTSRYWKVAEKFDIENKLRQAVKDYGFDIAIQLESCGSGIQGNKYGFADSTIFVFNVYNITHKKYFGLKELKEFCSKYNLQLVPILEVRKFDWKDVNELTKYADGCSLFGNKVLREGVVIRKVESCTPSRGMSNMWSFKVISPSFILKWQ